MDDLFGKYKGFVRRNDDPDGRGRLICYCPQVMGENDSEEHWLDWAEPCLPWMGNISTLDFGVPPVGKKSPSGKDEFIVWIEFEAGDVCFPIWTGVTPIVPRTTSPGVRVSSDSMFLQHGGSLIDNPGGSQLAPLKNAPPLNEHESRFMAKEGRDLLIGSHKGGGIICGPSGVHLVGVQVTINGQLVTAKTEG